LFILEARPDNHSSNYIYLSGQPASAFFTITNTCFTQGIRILSPISPPQHATHIHSHSNQRHGYSSKKNTHARLVHCLVNIGCLSFLIHGFSSGSTWQKLRGFNLPSALGIGSKDFYLLSTQSGFFRMVFIYWSCCCLETFEFFRF